jgi:branched-chain amino acid transport system permease protein
VTVGILLLVSPIVTTIWRNPPPTLSTPLKLDKFSIGDVQITWLNTTTILIGALVVTGFFLFFKYTKYGVAMRATAVDQEAALMQGINVNLVIALSWAIAGIVAVLGGTMLAAGAGPGVGLGVGIGIIALKALPAMVLGGLDSPGGAVVGGLAIGVAETMWKGYQNGIGIDWLEAPSFASLALPWIIMLVVLVVRPYGLFGTRQVQRL